MLCICVDIDLRKNLVAVVCGHGKPSSARMREAMGGRIEPGALLIHDPERAHNALVRDGGWIGYTDVDSSGRGAGDGRAE